MSLNRKSGRWIFMAAHRAMPAQSGAAAIRARFSPHNGNSEANHVRHRLSTQVYTISHKQADLVAFQGNQMSTKTISSRSLFWHLDSELMSKMIVMLRSEKVTVWEWWEWQMVLNQYTATRSPVHTRKASVGVQPLKISNLLLLAESWNTFFSSDEKVLEGGALMKSVIETWVLCQFWMTDVLVQTLLFPADFEYTVCQWGHMVVLAQKPHFISVEFPS